MLLTLEKALPLAAKRPGLLEPDAVLDLLGARRNLMLTAEDLAEYLCRPLEQVLHVLSYLTSFGLVATCRVNDAWHYKMA
ncbi:MAG TPA: hypothetical protein V6D47_00280 [Oscillatoriaceae cyanobacterium]